MDKSDNFASGSKPTCNLSDLESRHSASESIGSPHDAAANAEKPKKSKHNKRSWADKVENVLTKKPNAMTNFPKFIIVTAENNQLTKLSPFFIQKGLKGIGGDPKSVKKLRSGDLLIEVSSPLQAKSFLLAKSIGNIPISVTPHRTLNSSRGVISEYELLHVSESEITEELSGQGVTEAKRITIKKGTEIINTKHVILTFNTPSPPSHISAGYLRCSVKPYIPNPLRCFNCQRFGHSKNSCRGQETCSRCATAGHSFMDCQQEPKCVNCLGPHTSNSRSCSKWIQEKQIQQIKVTENISYPEARQKVLSSLPNQNKTYSSAVKTQQISVQTQTVISIAPTQILNLNSSTIKETEVSPKTNASTSTEIPMKQKVLKQQLKPPVKHTKHNKNSNKEIIYLTKRTESNCTSQISDSSDSGEMETEAGMETPTHLLPKSSKPVIRRVKKGT